MLDGEITEEQYNQVNAIVSKFSKTQKRDLRIALEDLEKLREDFNKFNLEIIEETNKPVTDSVRLAESANNRNKAEQGIRAKLKEVKDSFSVSLEEAEIEAESNGDDETKGLLMQIQQYDNPHKNFVKARVKTNQ